MKKYQQANKIYWTENDPYNDLSLKRCAKCLKGKQRKHFSKLRRNTDGLREACRTCDRIYKISTSRLAGRLYTNAKYRSIRDGIIFTISIKDIVIPNVCPVLEIPLIVSAGRQTDNSPTLDKIKNSLGYVPGNVHVISWRANRIKSDSTLEELTKLIQYMSRVKL